ncbi:hypothetical protein ACWGKU_35535 [Kitasatospora sp. NPDC054768]
MNEIILMSDPKVAAVPVQDCGERLSDVRSGGGPTPTTSLRVPAPTGNCSAAS